MKGRKYTLNCQGRLHVIDKPQIWGILNYTPDSFYDGGKYISLQKAIDRVGVMLEEGADTIDLGAMSSRPGATLSDATKEKEVISELVIEIKKIFPDVFLSVDTVHSLVAESAILAGADIINDISGGKIDPEMVSVVGKYRVPYIMMHMKGKPETMKSLNQYDDMVLEIMRYFKTQITAARAAGIEDIIIDPGFGFSKDISQNFSLLRQLNTFKILELPMMVGLSRKSTIYKTLNISPEEALNGTTALHMIALLNGSNILRVHDVKQAVECVKLYLSYMNQKNT